MYAPHQQQYSRICGYSYPPEVAAASSYVIPPSAASSFYGASQCNIAAAAAFFNGGHPFFGPAVAASQHVHGSNATAGVFQATYDVPKPPLACSAFNSSGPLRFNPSCDIVQDKCVSSSKSKRAKGN